MQGRRLRRLGHGVLLTQAVSNAQPLNAFWLEIKNCPDRQERYRRAKAVCESLAEALARAHQSGLRHLDLHAGNLLVRDEPGLVASSPNRTADSLRPLRQQSLHLAFRAAATVEGAIQVVPEVAGLSVLGVQLAISTTGLSTARAASSTVVGRLVHAVVAHFPSLRLNDSVSAEFATRAVRCAGPILPRVVFRAIVADLAWLQRAIPANGLAQGSGQDEVVQC